MSEVEVGKEHVIEQLRSEYGTGMEAGRARFENIIAEIKQAGRRQRYDCVIGVSGGTDSSYMVYLARRWGLRPLAVHYDNTASPRVVTVAFKGFDDGNGSYTPDSALYSYAENSDLSGNFSFVDAKPQ